MCELFALSSYEPVNTELSLEALAREGSYARHMNDGWGVAYYEDRDVCLIKDTAAAADSEWLKFIESHALSSNIILAHIRKASIGGKCYRNTQPYQRELAGRRHVFVHNGNLPGIFDSPKVRLGHYQPVGETDSEYAFCALLARLDAMWRNTSLPSEESRMACIHEFAAQLRELGPANFIYADGDLLFAHSHRRTQDDGELRPPGLHYLNRYCEPSADVIQKEGLKLSNQSKELTLFASTPLTSETWVAMEEGQILCAQAGYTLASKGQHNP